MPELTVAAFLVSIALLAFWAGWQCGARDLARWIAARRYPDERRLLYKEGFVAGLAWPKRPEGRIKR